jgi:3-methyladenine DNA glycosylase AlkD
MIALFVPAALVSASVCLSAQGQIRQVGRAIVEYRKRLEQRFEAARDPVRAAGASAYMRNLFPFYGIAAPEQRVIAREATAGLAAPSEVTLADVALACWERPEREWQYFACGYLRRHVKAASSGFITTAERLVTTKSWWDTVDTLASHTVGALVRIHPDLEAVMDDWIDSDDIWLARTAILHQLGSKAGTDRDRLFAYCLRRASEREFFIRKAIGWALREYSKTDEEAVRVFVRDNSDALSGLSRTEALKWLERRARRAGDG